MNQTTKVAVTLIVAAGLSSMVYALPEQRAMAHFRLHLLSPNISPDALPFGPNSPDPPLSASKSDPPGPHFGPNCVGCITTQNLANQSITTPKIAPGAVTLIRTLPLPENITKIPANTLSVPVTVFLS
jgi:hypothetical protein